MGNKVVVDGTSNVSAQQLSELFRQFGAGEISGSELQAFIEHRNPWSTPKAEPSYLRLLSDGTTKIVIGATDGQQTIAQAKTVFPGYIDPDFVNFADFKGQSTQNTPVQVHEQIRDGTFAQIFGSLGTGLNRLCLSQSQIIRFVTDHAQKLRAGGYGTFFLFKEKVGEQDEFFVARVDRDSGGLEVYVYRLSCGGVWHAGYGRRIVVPQL